MLRTTLTALACVGMLTGVTIAHAAGAPPAAITASGSHAKMAVIVIHAKKNGKTLDPKLSALQATLTRTFKPYNSFTQLDGQRVVAKRGETQRLELPNRTHLSYEYVGPAKEKGFLKVHIDVGGMKSTVRVKDGGTFFHAGRGYDNGMIILAVKATRSD